MHSEVNLLITKLKADMQMKWFSKRAQKEITSNYNRLFQMKQFFLLLSNIWAQSWVFIDVLICLFFNILQIICFSHKFTPDWS